MIVCLSSWADTVIYVFKIPKMFILKSYPSTLTCVSISIFKRVYNDLAALPGSDVPVEKKKRYVYDESYYILIFMPWGKIYKHPGQAYTLYKILYKG